MRITRTLPALAMMAVLAACSSGNPAATNAGPTSTASVGAASQMPQSPNSIPAGGAVTDPLTSPTGVVGQTTVGPGSPGAYNPDVTQQPTQQAARRTTRRRTRTAARRRAPQRTTAPASTSGSGTSGTGTPATGTTTR